MRSAPSVRIGLPPPWGWWWMWCVVAACAAGGLCAWITLHWALDGDALRTARLALLGLAVGAAGVGLWREWPPRRQAAALAWDGTHWWIEHTRPDMPALAGQVRVRMDLGPWMLLEFTPVAPTSSRYVASRRLVPLSRQGHRAPWHAMRCAVYSARHSEPLSTTSPTAQDAARS